MVQLSPITQFGSGAGYEYEDTVIHGFAHSNKGHWNLCYVPIIPVDGEVDPNDFCSSFSHTNESASPGYYQVFLDRWKINAELTTTLRCGFHRYTYQDGRDKKLIVNLGVSNERVSDWKIDRAGDFAVKGFQVARETVYFYAMANQKIKGIQMLDASPSLEAKTPTGLSTFFSSDSSHLRLFFHALRSVVKVGDLCQFKVLVWQPAWATAFKNASSRSS